MLFDKESVKRDVLKAYKPEMERLSQYEDLISKKLESQMDMAISMMQNEQSIAREQFEKLNKSYIQREKNLTLAKARAQVEIEKLKNELFSIKNNEQLNIIRYMNNHKLEMRREVPLASDVHFTPPVPLLVDELEPIFPMDMYDRERLIKGEEKLQEDALYYESDPALRKAGYHDHYYGNYVSELLQDQPLTTSNVYNPDSTTPGGYLHSITQTLSIDHD